MNNVKVWGIWNSSDELWLRRSYEPVYSLMKDDPKLVAIERSCDALRVKEIPLEIVAQYQFVSEAVERLLRLKKLDGELMEGK